MKLVTLATCNLDQWAMDFEGNLKRILESIKVAKEKGAKYRLGPELEIPGYGCEDHFLEGDTYRHCWEVLAHILNSDATDNMLCDFGMPVVHRNVRYNCRVFVLNRKLLLIRPKKVLADDGNYRESRWFTTWKHHFQVQDFYLPRIITALTGQTKVPIGDACIATRDTVLASETCEELFAPASPHISLGLNGVEIISNGSGSHHQLRKLYQRVDLMKGATTKGGGIYLYANQQGCDGGRLYFDGCSMILINGSVVAQGSQFSLKDVEVVIATVDLEDVRSFRGSIASRSVQASDSQDIIRIDADIFLTGGGKPSKEIEVKYLSPEEEIAYGPSAWLWDYLRRSGMGGYFLPLSGGADSASTAALIGIMTQKIVEEVSEGNEHVLEDVRRITGDPKYVPKDPKELAGRIFFTCYMGSANSSEATKNRYFAELFTFANIASAANIANQIGSVHTYMTIDEITKSFSQTFTQIFNKTPQFKVHGGSNTENLSLQNIQARSRMVLSYFLSQLLLWTRGKPGSLLVLGSANVDEALRGYYTKYDCSSADVNPIGGISKTDLKKFLVWAGNNCGYPGLKEIVEAPPTAELEPITENYTQSDEADMGMSYAELSIFGRLRKINRCGPVGMFEKLVVEWNELSPKEVAEKVKRFFYYYSINRHKMTTLTPSYHAESYSPDDNRYDLRQFLYNSKWSWQFKKIDELVGEMEKSKL